MLSQPLSESGHLVDDAALDRERRELQSETAHMPKVIVVVFVAVAFVMFVVRAMTAANTARTLGREQSTPSSTFLMGLVPLITGLLTLAFLGAAIMSIWLLRSP